MKIRNDHLAYIREQIAGVLHHAPDLPERYRAGDFARADKVRDLNTRYRWDLFFMAGLTSWACREVYNYADDRHIDTALRAIVADIV